jgi:hypothetical protein
VHSSNRQLQHGTPLTACNSSSSSSSSNGTVDAGSCCWHHGREQSCVWTGGGASIAVAPMHPELQAALMDFDCLIVYLKHIVIKLQYGLRHTSHHIAKSLRPCQWPHQLLLLSHCEPPTLVGNQASNLSHTRPPHLLLASPSALTDGYIAGWPACNSVQVDCESGAAGRLCPSPCARARLATLSAGRAQRRGKGLVPSCWEVQHAITNP